MTPTSRKMTLERDDSRQKTLNFIETSSKKSLRLGSLAWWGSALVRRGSRVRIPPEALNFRFGSRRYFSVRCARHSARLTIYRMLFHKQ